MKTIINNEGYIYCRARGGLNDSLNQLYHCTLYAIKYKYSIILDFATYNSLEITKTYEKIFRAYQNKRNEVRPAYVWRRRF